MQICFYFNQIGWFSAALCHLKVRRKKFRIYRCHPVFKQMTFWHWHWGKTDFDNSTELDTDTDNDTDTDTDVEESEEMHLTVWSADLSLDLDAQVAVESRPIYSNDSWLANYNNSISAADLPIFRIN